MVRHRSRNWRNRRGTVAVAAILLAGPLGHIATAFGQSPPPASSDGGSDALAKAKELNREGVALLEAGDFERALDYFRRSRAAYPSSKNIANVAICLDKLGRYDEALELYEELLTKYAAGLNNEDRAAIAPAMAALRAKVGSVTVSSNAGGAVIIDGRARGSLPLGSPVRVLEGKHVVRVLKDGYETFEVKVDVAVGQSTIIDALLKPLSGVGQLRIEDASGEGIPLFIDRTQVGVAPWEGIVAIGKHLVWSRHQGVGSEPAAVTVVERQTALIRLESRTLGPEIALRTEPRTALLEIDGTPVGAGLWRGALPVGEHTFVASEPGYQTITSKIAPRSSTSGEVQEIVLRLLVDPNHPRWPKVAKGHPWIDAVLGYAVTTGLASGAAGSCPSLCDGQHPGADGVLAGARIGYRFPFELSLELGGGFLDLSSSFARTAHSAFGDHDQFKVTYRLHDSITVRGPFASIGTSYRLRLGGSFAAVGRVSAGTVFAASHDPVDGTAKTTGAESPVLLSDRNATLDSVAFYLAPSLGAEARVGPITLGLALCMMGFATDGPAFGHGKFQATPNPDKSNPGAVGNARGSDVIADEKAYGPFVLWVPQASIGHVF